MSSFKFLLVSGRNLNGMSPLPRALSGTRTDGTGPPRLPPAEGGPSLHADKVLDVDVVVLDVVVVVVGELDCLHLVKWICTNKFTVSASKVMVIVHF